MYVRITLLRSCGKPDNIAIMKIETFFSRYTKQGDNGCLLFTGVKSKKGYGIVRIKRGDKWSSQTASRWVYERLNKITLDRWEFVCHKCDNPSCVNVSHLFLGTPRDNIQDMISKDRKAKSHAYHHRHKTVTHEQIAGIRAANGLLKDIASEFGVSVGYVSKIRNNVQKRDEEGAKRKEEIIRKRFAVYHM